MQALDWERLGPERKPYSESRRRRLAVQEAATALVATLQVSRRQQRALFNLSLPGKSTSLMQQPTDHGPCA